MLSQASSFNKALSFITLYKIMKPKYYFANFCTFMPFMALFLASKTRGFIVILYLVLHLRCPALLPEEGNTTEKTGRIRFCTKRPSFLFILIGKYVLEAEEVTSSRTGLE